MKTPDSDRYSGLFLGGLSKAARFDPHEHPKDPKGRWARKPGLSMAATSPVSLRHQASALRDIGEEAAARAVEERLREMGAAPRVERRPPQRVRRLPVRIPIPAPPPPPPTPQPQPGPMEETLGADEYGRPVMVLRPAKPKPPPRPAEVRPETPAAHYYPPPGGTLKVVQGGGHLPAAGHREIAIGDRAIRDFRDHTRMLSSDPRRQKRDFEIMVRESFKSSSMQLHPEHMMYFAQALERAGYDYLAEEGWDMLLYTKGVGRNGEYVEWEIEPPPEGPTVLPSPPSGQEPWKKGIKHRMDAVNSNLENIGLAERNFRSTIAKVRAMPGGIGETHKLTFRDGTKAVFKPTKGSGIGKFGDIRPGINPLISEANRERAAMEISAAMGLDVVPGVEFASFYLGSGGPGHVMEWVNGQEAKEAMFSALQGIALGNPDLHRLAALDFITGNTDRNGGNFMFGDDGRWYALDNGLSLCDDMNTEGYMSIPHDMLQGRRIPSEVKEEINSLSDKTLQGIMRMYGFRDEDIKGAVARLSVLKQMEAWSSVGGDLESARMFQESEGAWRVMR